MSLRLKMIVGIGAILLAVILAYAIVAVRSQETYLRYLARHEAELIAGVADRGLTRAMERGETDVVQAILRRMGEHPVLRGIRIVGSQGEILRSNRSAEEGRILPPEERPVEGEAPEPVWDFREQTVSVFRPIPRLPECARCHLREQPILGFLNVVVSFPAVGPGVGRHWTFMILSTVLSLIAAGALIGVFFTLVMGRRIEALSRTMSLVEAGDLTTRAQEQGPDELGRLAKSFNAMVAMLADARRQLEDRHADEIRRAEHLASLGKMAAGIAHEINNPLAGMQNCVRTLMKGTRDKDQRVTYFGMLMEGLDRIGRTVRQLLDFAREAKPQLARIHLRPLLRRCLTLMEHQSVARQISFSLAPDGNLPEVQVDPHQIEQVFTNILMNAVDAMPEGGKITVSTNLRKREDGFFIEVHIADTGVGISPEDLPRIFDPFFTTKDVGKATGLGLSVSYGIVRAHGGLIEVKSEIGKGSTFTVALPIKEEGEYDAPSDPAGGR
jgi:two-component system NtrC family sensor kinase